jgi:hypothetical protein
MLSGLALAQEPAAAPAATPAPAQAATPAPAAAPARAGVNEIKIICDGKVKVSGEAALIFTPDGGAAKELKVTLQKGMDKGEVCRDVAKELSVMLGAGYKVEKYDDDKVKVEGKNGAKFTITQGANSATGVTLEIK